MSMRKLLLVSFITALTTTTACRSATRGAPTGIDLAGMNKSVVPGDDFNAYANGGWIKATPIPPDKASYGSSRYLQMKLESKPFL